MTGASASGSPLLFVAPPDADCEGVRRVETTLAGLEGAFAGGAVRTAELHDGERLVAEVMEMVVGFGDPAGLDSVIVELTRAAAEPAFIACLQRVAELDGSEPEVETLAGAASAPNNGFAGAVRFRLGEEDLLDQHIFWWREESTLITLVIANWDGGLSDADVVRIVDAAGAAGRRAQRGSR